MDSWVGVKFQVPAYSYFKKDDKLNMVPEETGEHLGLTHCVSIISRIVKT